MESSDIMNLLNFVSRGSGKNIGSAIVPFPLPCFSREIRAANSADPIESDGSKAWSDRSAGTLAWPVMMCHAGE